MVAEVRLPLFPRELMIFWGRHEKRWRQNLHHGNKCGSKLETSDELSKKNQLVRNAAYRNGWLALVRFVVQLGYSDLQRNVLAGKKEHCEKRCIAPLNFSSPQVVVADSSRHWAYGVSLGAAAAGHSSRNHEAHG